VSTEAGEVPLRIVGELGKLGIEVSATSVRNILAEAGVPPAAQRDRQSWRTFLKVHADSILACDFFTVDTVRLRRPHVLAFLSIVSRRVEYLACTSNPNTTWMLQQARNLLVELDDRGRQVRFLIHDRDGKFPHAFDALMATEAIKVVRTPVQAPNANAHMERWVGSVRRECLDRILIVGRRQLELRPPSLYPSLQPWAASSRPRPETTRRKHSASRANQRGSARSAAAPPRPPRRPHPRIRARRSSMTTEFLHPTAGGLSPWPRAGKVDRDELKCSV
jgi:hypothetical protein